MLFGTSPVSLASMPAAETGNGAVTMMGWWRGLGATTEAAGSKFTRSNMALMFHRVGNYVRKREKTPLPFPRYKFLNGSYGSLKYICVNVNPPSLSQAGSGPVRREHPLQSQRKFIKATKWVEGSRAGDSLAYRSHKLTECL